MTDESRESHDEAVRRLLSETAGPEALPADVAARLDAMLARLVAEREEEGEEYIGQTADVVPFRHRRWPRLVLAAAAVVVTGYGIGTLAQKGSLSGSGSADNAAGGGVAASQAEAGHGSGSSSGKVPAPSDLARSAPVRLHSGGLPEQVRAILGPKDAARLPKQDSLSETNGFKAARCGPRRLPAHSTWRPATYDGQEAVLVLRPVRRAAEGHSVVAAEVLSCDGTVLDSATVRVR